MTKQKDVFLCHASEDKRLVVSPLVTAFDQADITYWYDKAEIKWGDSITEKVNEGLQISQYVIVILSKSFVSKNWPQRELNAALNLEASSGEVRVLPLIVGNQQEQDDILAAYPLLNDKSFLPWDTKPEDVVQELKVLLERSGPAVQAQQSTRTSSRFNIPIPNAGKAFTQREKDRYLSTAFDVIKAYFKEGAEQLNQSDSVVEADFEEIERYKFECSFYVRGDAANRCRIWRGGTMSRDTISYYEGQALDYMGEAMNDWLEVVEAHNTLTLKASGMSYSTPQGSDQEMQPEQAAKYFWLKATSHLNQY